MKRTLFIVLSLCSATAVAPDVNESIKNAV